MFELFALGLASLADKSLLMPRRREHLPEVHFSGPLPPVQIKNMDLVLQDLRNQAWMAFHQLETEAETVKQAKRAHLG